MQTWGGERKEGGSAHVANECGTREGDRAAGGGGGETGEGWAASSGGTTCCSGPGSSSFSSSAWTLAKLLKVFVKSAAG